MSFTIRMANAADVPELTALIDASVRGLQSGEYSQSQIEGALRAVYGVDSQLIADGTYFLVECESVKVGCGGWSRRRTLYGGDRFAAREDSMLDARTEAARIRAFFVHPAWARRGIGGIILDACEHAAREAGFTRLEMGATLTGVPFYRSKGYRAEEELAVPLPDGKTMTVVRMVKDMA